MMGDAGLRWHHCHRYKVAACEMGKKRKAALAAAAEDIEGGGALRIVGASAIEDKLQAGAGSELYSSQSECTLVTA